MKDIRVGLCGVSWDYKQSLIPKIIEIIAGKILWVSPERADLVIIGPFECYLTKNKRNLTPKIFRKDDQKEIYLDSISSISVSSSTIRGWDEDGELGHGREPALRIVGALFRDHSMAYRHGLAGRRFRRRLSVLHLATLLHAGRATDWPGARRRVHQSGADLRLRLQRPVAG